MTTMVWTNVLLAVPFVALWAGVPLWLVLRRPDTRPQPAVATPAVREMPATRVHAAYRGVPVGYASRRRMMANVPAISAAASRR
jgi:hypothetical protein